MSIIAINSKPSEFWGHIVDKSILEFAPADELAQWQTNYASDKLVNIVAERGAPEIIELCKELIVAFDSAVQSKAILSKPLQGLINGLRVAAYARAQEF